MNSEKTQQETELLMKFLEGRGLSPAAAIKVMSLAINTIAGVMDFADTVSPKETK